MPRARASVVGLRTDNGENRRNPNGCKFYKNIWMRCTWCYEMRCITRTKCKTNDKNQTTKEISYSISGKGKSQSYEYGKLYPGRYTRPHQMHQLHIHTCYIMYPIDLKSPLFTFISHTTFLLNKVWPKNILEFLHIYNITKLYGGVRTLICIAWCPQWYLFRTVNLYIFILYTKLVIIKRNEEHLSLHRIHPLYAPFTYAHKLSPGPLKVSP